MSVQQFLKTLEELSEKATLGPWRKSKGNFDNGIEGQSGKSDFYIGDDGYRMLATYQHCESTGKRKEEEVNQAANGDLIVFLANNRQQIIDLVKAADHMQKYGTGLSDLRETLAALKDK